MFKVGDNALVTEKIVRIDGRSQVLPGERVKITDVFHGEKYIVVNIKPYSGALPIRDVCCGSNGPLKWCA